MPPFVAIGAVAWTMLQAGSSFTPQISWTIDPRLKCPTRAEVEDAYFREGAARTADGATPLAVLVEIRGSPGTGIHIRLWIPTFQLTQHRDLEATQGSCEDIAQSISILVHAWMAELPKPEESSHPAEAGAAPEVPSDSWSRQPETDHGPSPGLVRIQGQNAPSPNWLGLTLALGAGLWLASNEAAAPSVALNAELRVSKGIRVGLLGAWVAELSSPDLPYGYLVVRRQLFGASASLAIPGVDRLGILGFDADLIAAFVVLHTGAQSFAYPVTAQHDLFDPGLLAGIRVRQVVAGALFLQAQVAAIILNRSYTFLALRPGGETAMVAMLPTFGMDIGLGVGVQIF